HHDDLGHRLRALHGTKDIDPVLRAHAQIRDEHVVRTGRTSVTTFLAALGLVDLEAGTAKHHGERCAHIALVVDDEEFGHRAPYTAPTGSSEARPWSVLISFAPSFGGASCREPHPESTRECG